MTMEKVDGIFLGYARHQATASARSMHNCLNPTTSQARLFPLVDSRESSAPMQCQKNCGEDASLAADEAVDSMAVSHKELRTAEALGANTLHNHLKW